MKVCKKCGKDKAITEFHTHPDYKDGHMSTCKLCISSRDKSKRETKTKKVDWFIWD